MDFAWSKHTFGNGLGNKVTGAVVAKTPSGSVSVDMRDGGGLTAKPFAMVQSLIVAARCSHSASDKFGG